MIEMAHLLLLVSRINMSDKNTIIRACLLYEFNLNSKASDAEKRICSSFGEGYVSVRTAQEWFSRFRAGCTSLTHHTHLTSPLQITTYSDLSTIMLKI